jgi:hypothetical protein
VENKILGPVLLWHSDQPKLQQATIGPCRDPLLKKLSTAALKKWLGVFAGYSGVQCLVQATGYLSGILIIHALDKREYAIYTIAGSMLGALNLLSDVGVSSALTAVGGRIYDNNTRLGRLLGSALRFRQRLAAVAASIGLPVFGWMLLKNEATVAFLFLVMAPVLVTCYWQLHYQVYLVVLKLRTQVYRLQKLDIYGSAARLLLLLLLLSTFPSVIGCLLVAAITAWFQLRILKGWIQSEITVDSESTEFASEISSSVKQLLASVIFYLLQGQLAIVLISIFGKTENIAEIGALSRLAAIFSILGAIISNIIAPRYARYSAPESLRSRFLQMAASSILLGSVLTVLAISFPSQLLLLLGPQYKNLVKEVSLMIGLASLTFATASMWSLNLSKGWTKGAWIQIPTTVLVQIVLLCILDFSQVSGILWFNLISTIPFFGLQFWLWRNGLKTSIKNAGHFVIENTG